LDNIIIYYYRQDPITGASHTEQLLRVVQAHPDWLLEGSPAMMLRIAPGIAYADDTRRSFGETRTEAMANGILTYMVEQGKTGITRDEFLMAAKQGLLSEGIDITYPYWAPTEAAT
jgi:hypothetical protein